jgi:hypothetical protein
VTPCAVAVSVACAAARAEGLLRARLDAKHLSYHWVRCTRERSAFRCNVNFGDPHIVQYCARVRGSRLVTDRDDARIRCGRKPDPFG